MSRSISASNLFRNQRMMAEHLGDRFGFDPADMRWFSGRLTPCERKAHAQTTTLKLAPVVPIEGFSSVETEDRHGTTFDQDGFDQDAWSDNPVGFFNHWPGDAVVLFDPDASEIRVDPKSGKRGLHDEGVVFGDTKIQAETQFNVVQRLAATLSIGFIELARTTDEDSDGNTRVVITAAEILEKSIVTIPSNRESLFDIAEAVERGSDIACPRCATDPARLVRLPNLQAALTSMAAHLDEAVRKGSRDDLLDVAQTLEGHLEAVRLRCNHRDDELPDACRAADDATDDEVATVVAATLEILERDAEAGT